MGDIASYQDLKVWQKSMDLAVRCYDLTRCFPDSERFGLVSQIRRYAVSIPANIAEGHGRRATGAYLYHLSIARGSLMELETDVLLSQRLQLSTEDRCAELLTAAAEIGRMLAGLIRSLERRSS